jgi:beta-lactam-binding protein with PASTA domain
MIHSSSKRDVGSQLRTFFRYVLLALVLLVVALVSALTTMRFAIRGREMRVPNFVGKTPSDARAMVESNSLQIQVERQYYSPSVAEGHILSQLPGAGTRVKRGWQVRVALSLGPQRVQIINVLGQSTRAAELNIRRRGLDLGSVAQIPLSAIPPDQVLSQSPPPNASQMSAPKLSLLVSEAAPPQAFVMPSFVGQPLGSATSVLQSAGFRLGSATMIVVPPSPPPPAPVAGAAQPSPTTPEQAPAPVVAASPTPASIIVSQSPLAGEKINAGSAVSFQVR